MLLLTAFIEVAPADRDRIRTALADVIASTRAEEGCEEYGCYEDTQRRGRFVFVERWRDKAALELHLATPHMAAWMEVAGPKLKSARGLLHDVASSTELRPK
jgi:quinol monooxygenase YgiN